VSTGAFQPFNGQGTQVDHDAATVDEVGNGPEWMLGPAGSELVYSRWVDGRPRTPGNLRIGHAGMGAGGWIADTLDNTAQRALPIGSMNLDDPSPAVHYQGLDASGRRGGVYWRNAQAESAETMLPVDGSDPAMTRRWVSGTRDIVVTAPAAPDASGTVYRQVFLFHTSDGTLEQLTVDPVDKQFAWMWQAPEYPGEYVFCTVVGGTKLAVYRHRTVRGVQHWAVVHALQMPASAPYIYAPDVFVHNGRSWVFFTLSTSPDPNDFSASTIVAMAGISNGNPLRFLTAAGSPPRNRRDPEYYITSNGPYIYYKRCVAATGGEPHVSEGVFRVDTRLGPPQASVPAPR
jgi:hypothetical protein